MFELWNKHILDGGGIKPGNLVENIVFIRVKC